MTARLSNITRAAWIWLAVVVAAIAFASTDARAQNATIDWANAGIPSQGALPSGTTATGSDGTVATITYSTQTEGIGTFTTPFAPTYVSYFSGTIGSGVSPLLLNFDNSSYDPRDKITMTITLNRSVSNLSFSLGDIDFGSFADAVEVYYDNDNTGAFTNAATNTAFWTVGSAVTRTNNTTVNGWRGTANSDTNSTNGNVNFNFGSQSVQRIQVVYFSYTGTGDPTSQFMGFSDLAYFAPNADLSLTKNLVGSPPIQGGVATYRLTVTNATSSTLTANGVAVRDTFPAGFNFTSASGTGSFNSSTRIWSVGSLAPGASATLTLQGTITSAAGTVVTNVAEITASSAYDPDSTVNNGNTGEDDYATATFTVQAGRSPGIPPVLSCPVGQSLFDWDTISGWANGSTSNSYAFSTFGNIGFALTNSPGGAFLNSADFGGQTPTVFNYYTGGRSPAQNSLHMLADQANQSGEVTITISLPRSFTGVQFSVFDVDFGANQFADRLVVTGSNGGTTVNPRLTNGNANYISGNTVIGDGASGNTDAFGNVVVTFTGTVDTITIRYGNHTTAPVDPGQQGISIHDITVCNPNAALSVTKVSSIIADPVNGTTNPKAIPGATVEYLISVTNTGTDAVDAGTVTITDDGPADAKMCLMGRAGGPVIFGNPGGSSGLSYNFAALGSNTDDLEFSSDNGATYTYTPVADGDGCDASITDFRLTPDGAFAGGATVTLTVRYIIIDN